MEAIAYEHGEGVAPSRATHKRNTTWDGCMPTGVALNDVTAAFFFHAAAEQELADAQRMLKIVGDATAEVPDCMRDPAPPPTTAPPVVTTRPSVDYQAMAPPKIFNLVMKMAPSTRSSPSWSWRSSLQKPTLTAWRGHPGTPRS